MEIWKTIKEFPNYKISNLGNVIKVDINGNKIKDVYKSKNGGRYYVVTFYDYNKARRKVHKLVAEAFLDKKDFKSWKDEDRTKIKEEDLVINHKDEIPTNNDVNNLEWCTIRYNNNYGHRLDRIKQHKVCQYDLQGNFIQVKDCAEDYCKEDEKNISTHILACCKKRRLSHNGYMWKFYDGSCNNILPYKQNKKDLKIKK